MKAFKVLVTTELKLAVRDMNMPIFAIMFPVVIAVILGLLYGTKQAFEGANYSFIAQSFGAVASIGICAAGLMGLPIVVSDYRHKKILKRFKVTPVGPVHLLAAQVVVNFFMALFSFICVYGVMVLGFGYRMQGSWLAFFGVFLLVSASIFSLGLLIASVSPNIQTSNLLCTIAYFPMLIFSGATLPYEVMPKEMQQIADFMPMTQGIKLLKHAALGQPLGNVVVSLLFLLGLTFICTTVSVKCFKWE